MICAFCGEGQAKDGICQYCEMEVRQYLMLDSQATGRVRAAAEYYVGQLVYLGEEYIRSALRSFFASTLTR